MAWKWKSLSALVVKHRHFRAQSAVRIPIFIFPGSSGPTHTHKEHKEHVDGEVFHLIQGGKGITISVFSPVLVTVDEALVTSPVPSMPLEDQSSSKLNFCRFLPFVVRCFPQ